MSVPKKILALISEEADLADRLHKVRVQLRPYDLSEILHLPPRLRDWLLEQDVFFDYTKAEPDWKGNSSSRLTVRINDTSLEHSYDRNDDVRISLQSVTHKDKVDQWSKAFEAIFNNDKPKKGEEGYEIYQTFLRAKNKASIDKLVRLICPSAAILMLCLKQDPKNFRFS